MNPTEIKPCPKCGKPMIEQPTFPGLWMCPDYAKPTNKKPPFQFKCTGMELTAAGAEALDAEVLKLLMLN